MQKPIHFSLTRPETWYRCRQEHSLTKAKGLEAVLSYTKIFAGKHSIRATLAGTFINNEVKKDANGKPIIHASDILVNGGQLKNYFNREDQSRVELANPKNKVSLMLN